METRSRAKLSGKRQRENAEIEARKSQRLPLPAESVSTTKIIDVNDDCLMKIFGQLDLRSLCNVGIANAWLRPAAREVYKRKFGGEMLYFRCCGIVRPNTRAKNHETDTNNYFTLDVFERKIEIYGLKLSLQFLRCFGPSIIRLCVDYGRISSKQFDYVHQYINDYCAGTLTWIHFQSMPNIEIEQFQNVFVHIETLSVSGELGRQWPTFVKCFPNVRELCFERVNIVDRCPEQPFKHLDKFFLQESRCIGFTMHQFAADVLSGIHQLKQFVITSIADDEPRNPIGTLLNVIQSNPLLDELVYELDKRELIPVNAAEVQRIVAEYPTLVQLWLEDYQFTADDAMAVVRQLNWLEKFKFQMLKSEFEHIKTQMDDDWHAVDDDTEFDMAFDDNHACVMFFHHHRSK